MTDYGRLPDLRVAISEKYKEIPGPSVDGATLRTHADREQLRIAKEYIVKRCENAFKIIDEELCKVAMRGEREAIFSTLDFGLDRRDPDEVRMFRSHLIFVYSRDKSLTCGTGEVCGYNWFKISF